MVLPNKEARILVVDDDKELADTLVEYLLKIGYEASPAYGGARFKFQILRRELDLHKWPLEFCMYFSTRTTALLHLLTHSGKHSLSHFPRDETMKLLLHAFLKQPRFFLLGLRALYPFPVIPGMGKIISTDAPYFYPIMHFR